jgi:hypothetical protein
MAGMQRLHGAHASMQTLHARPDKPCSTAASRPVRVRDGKTRIRILQAWKAHARPHRLPKIPTDLSKGWEGAGDGLGYLQGMGQPVNNV